MRGLPVHAIHRMQTLWVAPALFLLAGCPIGSIQEMWNMARLERMRAEILQMVADTRCDGPDECRAIAFGSKPCGGPWTYLIYSKARVDSALLAQKVAAYNAFEDEINRKYARTSDCGVPPRPEPGCIDGHCRDTRRAAHIVFDRSMKEP